MGKGLIFLLLSILFQSLSIILGKFASLSIAHFTARGIFSNGYYLGSLACLALQAVVWPLALRRFPLFWAYLFMSAVYIVIPLAGHFVFGETLTPNNIVGALLIMAGIAVMSLGSRRPAHG